MSNFSRVCAASALVCNGLATAAAAAADYPDRPVRIIVPSAAGGAPDVTTRIVAAELTRQMNQQFVVDNRPGAAGAIGTLAVAKSPNDGYTLLMSAIGTTASAMSYYAKPGYDLRSDFTPISMLGTPDGMWRTRCRCVWPAV